MKLLKFKNMAMIGAMSIAGVGLVGVGAHATFTQNTVSSQDVSTGTLEVVLSGAGTLSNSNQTLTLAPIGPEGSTFTTGDTLVTMTNDGSLPANELTSTIAVGGGSDLASEAFACETSFGLPNQTDPIIIYNGPLSNLVGTTDIGGAIAPAGYDGYTVNVYAGSATTLCGTGFTNGTGAAGGTGVAVSPGAPTSSGISTAPSLVDAAEGETITVSNTIAYNA